MKRFLIVLLLLILLAGLATPFVIKSFKDYSGTEESTTDVITEPSIETTDNAADESTTAETTTEEPTTFTPTPSIPEGNSGTILGTSSKGYDIIEVNGLTYINGILVVNKTYSVPAGYNPGALTAECKNAFREMQSAADELGLSLTVCSGFRSYETQKNLYNKYCEKDGKALADTYSARPGHSEHQTGLAIDVNSVKQSFKDTPEGKWLKENCHKYGFILRYPEDKQSVTGYSYEPWHIRYVGKTAAKDIYESGLCLEEYLGIKSVYANSYQEETTAKPVVPETTTKAPVQETTTKPLVQETTTKAPVQETTTVVQETTTAVQETTTAVQETTTVVQETTTVVETTAATEETTAADTPE
ncbi:MAG: M15 family metallopeptidase [Clostridia bacterium]|nr:M15 family metallopeptidase [Clostridia bacterium]